MTWYDTKKWILKHLGKKEKDVRWLDRLIRLGVVLEKGWRYISRNDLERQEVLKLKQRNMELEEENKRLQKVAEWEVNARYYENLYLEEQKRIPAILLRSYDFIHEMPKRWVKLMEVKYEDFKNWVLGGGGEE